jgi:hypothetical protein
MIHVHAYRVGMFDHWRNGNIRRARPYLTRQIKAHNWRAVRNYFNGWLAEHEGCHHNAGRGWTEKAACRRALAICEREAGKQS